MSETVTEKKPRVLFLGNSFTFVNDLPAMFSAYTGCETDSVTRGGAYLRQMLDEKDELCARVNEKLAQGPWDMVVLQEQSFNAAGARQDYLRSVRLLCEKVRAVGARPVIYATWSYRDGSAKLNSTGLSYREMLARLDASFRQAAEENDAVPAPVGDAFAVAGERHCLLAPDDFHPSLSGTYLAVCVIAHALGLPESEWTPGRDEYPQGQAYKALRDIAFGRYAARIRQAAFTGSGKMLKGNLHTHTKRSDGKGMTDTVVRQYAQNGYDFLALTDHRFYNYVNYAPETGILVIPSMEHNTKEIAGEARHVLHAIALGDTENNGYAQDENPPAPVITHISQAQCMLDEINGRNNIAIVCHPEWSGTPAKEIEMWHGFKLMEIWNSATAVWYGYDNHAAYWDELLQDGHIVYGVASDDCHSMSHVGLGFVRVNAEKNIPSILKALESGAFYASCGPEIYDFYVENGEAVIRCSPVSQIRFRSLHFAPRVLEGNGITGGEAQMQDVPYVRAEVIDAQGRMAWTNPIFLDGRTHTYLSEK